MSAEAASAKAASAEATSVQSSARRDGTLHPEYPAPRVQSSAPRDGGAGLTAAGTTGQGGATGHGSGVQGTARSSGMPARPSFRESDRAGTLTIQLEARLVPWKFETIAKGKLVPLTLLRPKDTVGAGQVRARAVNSSRTHMERERALDDSERTARIPRVDRRPAQSACAVRCGTAPRTRTWTTCSGMTGSERAGVVPRQTSRSSRQMQCWQGSHPSAPPLAQDGR